MMDRIERAHRMSSPVVAEIKTPLPQEVILVGPIELERQSTLKVQTYVGKILREGR